MAQKQIREIRTRKTEKKKTKPGWKARGTGKKAKLTIIKGLLERALYLSKKGRGEEAEKIRQKIKAIRESI